MAERITDRLVKELQPPAKGNRITYDTEVRGFGARITAAGAVSFILNYRNAEGRERRHTIGRYPDFTVAAARAAAKTLKQSIKTEGADPAGSARERRQAPDVRDLVEHFDREHVSGLRPVTQRDYRALLRDYIVPVLGALKVASVEAGDIRRLKARAGDRHATANRALAVASKLFSFAIAEGYRPDRSNPAVGIPRYTEDRRERYLSQAEMARLSEVLAEHHPRNSANLIRFLMLTGCRSGEAFKARWDEIDFERGTWSKPSAHTKQKRRHVVPLSAPALQLLQGLPRRCEWVFPSPRRRTLPSGEIITTLEPVTTLKTSWATIRRKAGIPDVRLHDLRHSFASLLVSGGASLPLVGALLGHTQPATTARYAHLHDEPLREATELVGRVITSAGKPAAEVVEVKRGR